MNIIFSICRKIVVYYQGYLLNVYAPSLKNCTQILLILELQTTPTSSQMPHLPPTTYQKVCSDEDPRRTRPELSHDDVSVFLLHVSMLHTRTHTHTHKVAPPMIPYPSTSLRPTPYHMPI